MIVDMLYALLAYAAFHGVVSYLSRALHLEVKLSIEPPPVQAVDDVEVKLSFGSECPISSRPPVQVIDDVEKKCD